MKCLLYIRDGPDLHLEDVFPEYASALVSGQTFGHGLFHIDTGLRVPSRDTQLGLTPDSYLKQKKLRILPKLNKLLDSD